MDLLKRITQNLLIFLLLKVLDAFLADVDFDCENIVQKTSMVPADAMRSADPFDLQQKVKVSRTLPCSEHDIKYIAKRNNTERSKNMLDLTIVIRRDWL